MQPATDLTSCSVGSLFGHRPVQQARWLTLSPIGLKHTPPPENAIEELKPSKNRRKRLHPRHLELHSTPRSRNLRALPERVDSSRRNPQSVHGHIYDPLLRDLSSALTGPNSHANPLAEMLKTYAEEQSFSYKTFTFVDFRAFSRDLRPRLRGPLRPRDAPAVQRLDSGLLARDVSRRRKAAFQVGGLILWEPQEAGKIGVCQVPKRF